MKKLFFLFIFISLMASTSEAQVRVVKSADRKLSINLAGLQVDRDSAAQLFFQTLENDLKRSGWFAPYRGSGELQLFGKVQRNGGKVKASCQIVRQTDRARLFGKSYALDADLARTLAHRVADDIVEAITGRKGIASTKIAVVGSRSGAKELYLCDMDGKGITQLTQDKSIVVGPNWTPDGKSLIYTSYFRGFPDTYFHNLSGKRTSISKYPGLNSGAVVSPNGQEIALILSKDGNPELYTKNLRSQKLTRLTRTRTAAEGSPSWSPDGQQLVYVSDQSGTPQLYTISRSGGRPRRLSTRGSENVAPDWGPNGKIACASRSGGRYAIAIINPASGATSVLQPDGADYEDPSWTPDGRHLVVTRTIRYQSSLYLLDTISDPPVALLQGGGDWFSPACSPR